MAGGALVGTFILGPIYFHRAQLNGAPFKEGDLVEILVGPKRGRAVRVRESMNGRGMVKVNLGEQATANGKSIFGSEDYFEETQLLKIIDAEQPLAGDAPQAARL